MKNIINLTESDLHRIINKTVKMILREGLYDNSVSFVLISKANGNVKFTVPYDEFINARFKLDYLWQKCAEQNDIRIMRNGYFIVSPNDPHKEEIERNYL